MEAVAQSVKNTLGINARAEALPTFAVLRQQVNAHKMKGPYRAAWQEDYPDVENWIGPLYVTGGSSNDGLYSNPQVDALYKEGTGAANVDDAHAKFAEATKIIDQDVPSMPIYFYSQQWGYSTKLKKVEVSWVGEIDLSSVEIA
jgi:oligopeptide transport system substrate-binding protein